MHSRRFIFIVFCELHILHYKEEFGSHLTTGSASRSAWVEEAQLGHRSDLFFVQYDDCVWHWASISVEIVGLSYRQWSLWGQYTAQAWGNKATQARIRIYIYCKKTVPLSQSHVDSSSWGSPLFPPLQVGGCPLCCRSKLTTGHAQLPFPKASNLYKYQSPLKMNSMCHD